MEIESWLPAQMSQDIWQRKYQFEGETFEEWLDRVSNHDAETAHLILNKQLIFAGRILANRGLQHYGKKITYSNCYDIPSPEDNIEAIFDNLKYMARTFSYGGGCGTGLYKLRPTGAPVNNAAKESSGSVSFAPLINLATAIISQKGRRGAAMIFQMVNHPDIESFIKLKADLISLQKTNISVGIFEDFIDACIMDLDYPLVFEEKQYQVVKARELLLQIAFQAWDTGDPGALYWDRINNWNIVSEDAEYIIDAPNPCGEQPLIKWGACALASTNLSAFIVNPFTQHAYFDIEEFNKVIRKAVVEMNKILDEGMNLHPLPEQKQVSHDWRNIGIGIMGMADALVKLGYRYGSQEHIDLINEFGSNMINQALQQSALLAKEFGTYPKYKADCVLASPFIIENATPETYALIEKYGLRNCSLLTIAPTGTLSNLWEISGGGEPYYDLSYDRLTESLYEEDKHYTVYTKVVEDYANFNHIEKDSNGIYQGLPEFITKSTAKNLDWHERINVQATLQKYVDSAISSTINLPEETTVREIYDIYVECGKAGCKGVTVFRDGCRRTGVLSTPKTKEDIEYLEDNEIDYKFDTITPISRHELGETYGSTIDKKTACGKMFITINHDKTNHIVESFISIGKAGMCQANLNAVNRLISICLRSGIKVEEVIHQLKGIRCDSCRTLITKGQKLDGISCPDVIGRVLEAKYAQLMAGVTTGRIQCKVPNVVAKMSTEETIKEMDEMDKIVKSIQTDEIIDDGRLECPDCHTPLRAQGGCPVCPNCGWSSCG